MTRDREAERLVSALCVRLNQGSDERHKQRRQGDERNNVGARTLGSLRACPKINYLLFFFRILLVAASSEYCFFF